MEVLSLPVIRVANRAVTVFEFAESSARIAWEIAKGTWELTVFLTPKVARLLYGFLLFLAVVGMMMLRRGREFRRWCDRLVEESLQVLDGGEASEEFAVPAAVVAQLVPNWVRFRGWLLSLFGLGRRRWTIAR